MGLYTRRQDSSRSPFPPTISVPPPSLLHNSSQVGPTSNNNLHSRRRSSPSISLPPISPPPNAFNSRNESSSPFTSFPPISPPSKSHSRRDSYPGPFPNLPSPSNSEQSLFHTRNESCPQPFPFPCPSSPRQHHSSTSSDPSLLPSTSSPQKRLPIRNRNNSVTDLLWPFGEIEGNGVDDDDIRETAYEVFFTACRSSPGFGGRSALTFYSRHENGNDNGNGGGMSQVPVSSTSRVKRALGLKMLKNSFSQRIMSRGDWNSMPLSPVAGDSSPRARVGLPRRTMTMAEVMRLQMGVSESSDSRLRKTLMRTLVGQVS